MTASQLAQKVLATRRPVHGWRIERLEGKRWIGCGHLMALEGEESPQHVVSRFIGYAPFYREQAYQLRAVAL
jgi:hypothetical protein